MSKHWILPIQFWFESKEAAEAYASKLARGEGPPEVLGFSGTAPYSVEFELQPGWRERLNRFSQDSATGEGLGDFMARYVNEP